jgi:hypothetical protein
MASVRGDPSFSSVARDPSVPGARLGAGAACDAAVPASRRPLGRGPAPRRRDRWPAFRSGGYLGARDRVGGRLRGAPCSVRSGLSASGHSGQENARSPWREGRSALRGGAKRGLARRARVGGCRRCRGNGLSRASALQRGDALLVGAVAAADGSSVDRGTPRYCGAPVRAEIRRSRTSRSSLRATRSTVHAFPGRVIMYTGTFSATSAAQKNISVGHSSRRNVAR